MYKTELRIVSPSISNVNFISPWEPGCCGPNWTNIDRSSRLSAAENLKNRIKLSKLVGGGLGLGLGSKGLIY